MAKARDISGIGRSGRQFAAMEIWLANWLEPGETSGGGGDDRRHGRHGAQPKLMFLYPLRRFALKQLRGSSGAHERAALSIAESLCPGRSGL